MREDLKGKVIRSVSSYHFLRAFFPQSLLILFPFLSLWPHVLILCARVDGDVPTLWLCELPEGWQGDDGMGH